MDSDAGGPRTPPSLRFQGIAASQGIAIGHAVIFRAPQERLLHWRSVPPPERPHHLERYQNARKVLLDSIRAGMNLAAGALPEAMAIVESYELIISDPAIEGTITHRILGEGMPAEVAVSTVYDAHIHALANASDPLLRERRYDLENIRQKLVAALLSPSATSESLRDAIIVAPSLLASDVLQYHDQGARGIVTEVGGISSHACIVARTLGMPAVIGIRNATRLLDDNVQVIVDGTNGLVLVSPDETTTAHYRALRQIRTHHRPIHSEIVTTTDGIAIPVYASVDSPDDVPFALAQGADGIGLVRTEFHLVHLNHFPSEQEQTAWYRAIVERAYPKPVTLRIFDLGSDKVIAGMPHEQNPALGLRGLRFLLRRRDLLSAQLRAILRASAQQTVRLLAPMVTTMEEVETLLTLLESAKQELRDNREPFDDRIPLGIMVETPAAALLADQLAGHVAFFSIGTNDLTQYTLAADRTSNLVAYLFDQLHPAVLRLLQMIVSAAKRRGIHAELCGDLATFLSATELLVGLGIRALSVAPTSIPALKEKISAINAAQAERLLEHALATSDSAAIRALLNNQHLSP
ncbi:MAG: phosphoenolpyruvate--protein phosphotransferase [Chlorobiota bacterium]|nr:MAG: phosphoenolpyruvate--protein phosphotransferase [Chlorobiota bacterium]